jgi:ribonuclease BN (tRNA processing enzyme)
MFQIQFIGVGSAFTTPEYYQSNALVIAESGKKMLLDCGTHAQFALLELGINNTNVGNEIDAVYISHLHADHIGSLEWLALVTYFNPSFKRPTLFAEQRLMKNLWSKSLRGGLETLEGKVAVMTDFFDCRSLIINNYYEWENIRFTPIQTLHIVSGMKFEHSYGIIMEEKDKDGEKVFFTTDTQFSPYQLRKFYDTSTTIFQDCETAPIKSGIHAHFDDLCTLSEETRNKMWLYHYQPNPPQNPVESGFRGFAKKGQIFTFNA